MLYYRISQGSALVLASMLLAGCGASFNPVGNPVRPPQFTEPPQAPEIKQVVEDAAAKTDTAIHSSVVSARRISGLGNTILGLGPFYPFEVDNGATDQLSTMVMGLTGLLGEEHEPGGSARKVNTSSALPQGIAGVIGLHEFRNLLVTRFLSQGLKKVVDLNAPGANVVVTLSTEQEPSRNNRQTVRLTGGLNRMAFVGKVSSASYVLHGDFTEFGFASIESAENWEYSPEEMATYTAEFDKWKKETEEKLAKLKSDSAEYQSLYQQSVGDFRADGGEFPPPPDQLDSPAGKAKERHDFYTGNVTRLTEQLQNALNTAVSPEVLQADAESKGNTFSLDVAKIVLTAKLIDAGSGEIVWINEIKKSKIVPKELANGRTVTLRQALQEVIDKMIADLIAAGGSRETTASEAPAEGEETERDRRRRERRERREERRRRRQESEAERD